MSSPADSIPLTDLRPAFEVRNAARSQRNNQDSNTRSEWPEDGIIDTERHTVHVSASNTTGGQEVEIEQQESIAVQIGSNTAALEARTTISATQSTLKATKQKAIKEWWNSIIAAMAVMTGAYIFTCSINNQAMPIDWH
jgi:hypothetical protein